MTTTLSILLVEDEEDLSLAIAVRLRATGFRCETAGNGRLALEKLRDYHPDLVIADLLMPEMDGYTLIRNLRADPATAALPVLVLTAVPEYVRAQRAEDLKGVRVLQKPFDSEALMAAIREVLSTSTPHG